MARSFHPGRLAGSVERFYEAAANPALWRGALHEFSQAAGVEGAILHVDHLAGNPAFVHSEALDASFPEFLRDGWHLRNDSLRRAEPALAAAPVMTDGTVFSAGEYMRDPMHMEFLRPNGFGWFAAVQALRSPEADVLVSLQRSWRDEPFSRDEVEVLGRLVPHLRRAARIAVLTGPARAQGVLDGFALLEVPAFLVGRAGEVSRLNDAAERLLGRGLDVSGRRLVSAEPSVSAGLHRLAMGLATGLAADVPAGEADLPGPVRVPRPPGRGLAVFGAPLPRGVRDLFGAARAVLVAVDLDAGRGGAARHLGRIAGLTRAEAETAVALADGLEFREIAARRGVGLETVRSQAKSVGAKMGAHTRGSLVALMNRMVMRVPEPGEGR